jgi:hypothetical protein
LIGIITTSTLFVFTPILNQNHTAMAQQQKQQLSGIQSSGALFQEDEETAYLKFASQTVKQFSNNSATAANIQLPEAAKGPPIPAKGYLVQQIRGGLYWLTDGAYQTMFMVTDKGVVAVDAPPTIGNNYLKAIAEVTTKPVTYVIYSHAHIDHIGAAGIFPKNATFIAQQETAAELQREKSVAKMLPWYHNSYCYFYQELYIADRKSNSKVRLLWRQSFAWKYIHLCSNAKGANAN